VDHHRAHPKEKNELLNAMINRVDPKTGGKLRDELVIAQMITFSNCRLVDSVTLRVDTNHLRQDTKPPRDCYHSRS